MYCIDDFSNYGNAPNRNLPRVRVNAIYFTIAGSIDDMTSSRNPLHLAV